MCYVKYNFYMSEPKARSRTHEEIFNILTHSPYITDGASKDSIMNICPNYLSLK